MSTIDYLIQGFGTALIWYNILICFCWGIDWDRCWCVTRDWTDERCCPANSSNGFNYWRAPSGTSSNKCNYFTCWSLLWSDVWRFDHFHSIKYTRGILFSCDNFGWLPDGEKRKGWKCLIDSGNRIFRGRYCYTGVR